MKIEEYRNRSVEALERIAKSLEEKEITDFKGMKIAENFTNIIGAIIKAENNGPDNPEDEAHECPNCGEDGFIDGNSSGQIVCRKCHHAWEKKLQDLPQPPYDGVTPTEPGVGRGF